MTYKLAHPLILSLLIACSQGTLGATTEISVSELTALGSSQLHRADFAEKLAAFYRRLNDDIPNLTPQEAEWLQKETERTGRSRSDQAMVDRMKVEQSREWHISHAKEQLESLEKEAREIAKYIREDKMGFISNEMVRWVLFSSHQLRVNPFDHYLELVLHYRLPASSAIPLMAGWPEKVAETPNQIALTINDWILKPYLWDHTFVQATEQPSSATEAPGAPPKPEGTNDTPTKQRR
jgi:hypothetical protein